MIISHQHRFIFIKTKKTAGTSVEIALSNICGAADVITPISPADEQIRAQTGGRGAQHFRVPFRYYSPRAWVRLLLRGKPLKFYNHIGAARIRRCVSPSVWDGYYKFCFERNPWDKIVSLYYWKHQREPRPSLSEFIQSGRAFSIRRSGGYGIYTIDDEIVVDRVCRFENLAQDLAEVAITLNVPPLPDLPRAKSAQRQDKRHYRELLSPVDREAVATAFAKEIALFGYTY